MLRVVLIVVLLVLTPWRAWAADAMAVQMAGEGMRLPASSTVTAPTVHCQEMAEAAHLEQANPSDEGAAAHTAHPCSNCAFCQVCATVGLLSSALFSAASPLLHALAWAPAATFASASLAAGQKPPIS